MIFIGIPQHVADPVSAPLCEVLSVHASEFIDCSAQISSVATVTCYVHVQYHSEATFHFKLLNCSVPDEVGTWHGGRSSGIWFVHTPSFEVQCSL